MDNKDIEKLIEKMKNRFERRLDRHVESIQGLLDGEICGIERIKSEAFSSEVTGFLHSVLVQYESDSKEMKAFVTFTGNEMYAAIVVKLGAAIGKAMAEKSDTKPDSNDLEEYELWITKI